MAVCDVYVMYVRCMCDVCVMYLQCVCDVWLTLVRLHQWRCVMYVRCMYDVLAMYVAMHSAGSCVYSNGDEYKGEWRDDKKHGAGNYLLKWRCINGTKRVAE